MHSKANYHIWLIAVICISLGLIVGYLMARPALFTKNADTKLAGTASPKIITIAGDISCAPGDEKTDFACRSDDTADLISSLKPDAALTTGDNQYPNGALQSYQDAYDKTWGAFKDKTFPTPGNHEYQTPNAAGYYDYFGERAGERGKGYYHYRVGDWLLVALNSEIDVSVNSEQVKWLKAVLSANKTTCTLAYWHKPRFSTGGHPSDTTLDAIWRILYDYDVDIVANGHSHGYERYVPQNPDGAADAGRGVTQFVVGTGGSKAQNFNNNLPTLVTRQNHAFGVLRLNLYPKAAQYSFVAIPSQQAYSDSGVIPCH